MGAEALQRRENRTINRLHEGLFFPETQWRLVNGATANGDGAGDGDGDGDGNSAQYPRMTVPTVSKAQN